MLHATVQTNSYQANLNSAVSQAISGAKPDLIANNNITQQAIRATGEVKETKSVTQEYTTLSKESVSKAIDDQVSEFFTRYPNGGTDQDVAQFLESIRLNGTF
ncbi:MAG: hypothetical protein HQL69_13560 [Magnetococcales bacterium]|nr:hypothetical protein [Magnetococcales bacterium]